MDGSTLSLGLDDRSKKIKIMRSLILFVLCLLLFACSHNDNAGRESADSAKIDLIPKKDTIPVADHDSLHSEITCPKCGFKKTELLPTDVCLLKYTCGTCHYEMLPKEGDCCVFCTYGDVKCPSKQ
jgi:hypothetical protein